MKAGGFPPPPSSTFCIRRRIGQAAVCKAVAPREHGGSSPSWCIDGRLGTGTPSSPENCRGLNAPVGSTPAPSANRNDEPGTMNDELKTVCLTVHRSAFLVHPSPEPVAQKDQSAGMRRLRPHVRVVPGSLLFRGRLKGGRLPLEQVMEVRLLPPESSGTSAGVA